MNRNRVPCTPIVIFRIAGFLACLLTMTGNHFAHALECPTKVKKAITFQGKIDLNRATEADLREIPRVGIKTARAILDHRKKIRGFKSMDQLSRVRGVGDKTLACLQKYAQVGEPVPAQGQVLPADANRKR